MIKLFTIIKENMYDPTCVPHFEFIESSEDSFTTIGVTNTNLLNTIAISNYD